MIMVKKSVQLVICLLSLLTIELCSAANVDETCPTGPTDCTVPNSECVSGTCKCVGTHYKSSATVCTSKGGFGGVCLTATGDSTCLYSLKCTSDTCQCTTPASQFFDTTDNTCKAKIVLEAACAPGPTNQCVDASAECKADTNNVNKCLCKTTHYKDSSSACAVKIALEATCTSGLTDQCKDVNAECKADTNSAYKCLCKTTHYKDASGACVAKIVLESACAAGSTDQCLDASAECKVDTDNANKCLCKTTHYKASSGSCVAKIALEATCTTGITDQCLDASAECKADTDSTNKCLCKTTHYKHTNGSCVGKGGFGGVCVTATGDSTCLYSLKCADTCQCTTPANQFFDATDNLCKAKVALEATCTPGITDQCIDTSAECKIDADNAKKCLCKTTHFKDSSGACAAKIALEATCTPGLTDQCLDASAECKQDTDSTNKCLCKTTYYKASNGACVAKGGFGGVCVTATGDSTCLYSLKCATNTCQCTTPANQFFDSTDKTCKAKIALNMDCTIETDKPCVEPMAVCTQHGSGPNKCMCDSDSYPSNDKCFARKLHNINCMENGHVNECVVNAECKKVNNEFKCQCTNGAEENGKCNGVTVISANFVLTIVCLIGSIVYMILK
ncbi:multiple epidermal growth factor-like domains protein 10 [Mytilus trossulus]|uniref:multiple epidermal growth factor-like domains protein 10 n=1 Tax=Mytilus trossulus TaxID=6551 RepID=UPI003003CB32